MNGMVVSTKSFVRNRGTLREYFLLDNDALMNSYSDELKERVAELAYNLIAPHTSNSLEDTLQMEQKVINIYMETREYSKYDSYAEVPFIDIFNEVEMHNSDIIAELADMEYRHGPQNYAADNEDDDFDEILTFMEGEYQELLLRREVVDISLEVFVSNVLDKYRLSYSFDEYDEIHSNISADRVILRDRNTVLVRNSCQNILLSEFMYYGFAGYGSYMNYHEEYDVGSNLLGGGVL